MYRGGGGGGGGGAGGGGGGGNLDEPRWFERHHESLSFEEEKAGLMGKSYFVRAAKERYQYLQRQPRQRWEAWESKQFYDMLQRELCRWLATQASREILADKEAMVAAMAVCGEMYGRCAYPICDDPDVALAAFRDCEQAFGSLSPDQQDDPDLFIEAIAISPYALRYASPALKDNYEFMRRAIQVNPWSLALASRGLRSSPELAELALERQVATTGIEEKSLLDYLFIHEQGDLYRLIQYDGRALLEMDPDDVLSDQEPIDLVIRAMRRTPGRDQRHSCKRVMRGIPDACEDLSLDQYERAASWIVAASGETAPDLLVAITIHRTGEMAGRIVCRAQLGQGTPFDCDFSLVQRADDGSLVGEVETLEHLVAKLVDQLVLRQEEGFDPRGRIFVGVRYKRNAQDEGGVAARVRPYDYNYPVKDIRRYIQQRRWRDDADWD